MQYVYILECSDQSSYTGCTGDLRKRFERHMAGNVSSTKAKLPVKILFYCSFEDKYKAFEFEKYLKSGSGRAFMERHLV
jgi:putative endonuclease